MTFISASLGRRLSYANRRFVIPLGSLILPWALVFILAFQPAVWFFQNEFGNKLVVTVLEYREDGRFYQIVEPSHRQMIRGRWSARIETLDGRYICSGGDYAPYEPRTFPLAMTPDEWTGGDCKNLTPGDEYKASATWTYTGGSGQEVTISESFEFTAIDPGV